MPKKDIAVPGNISVRQSKLNFIDRHRVGYGFKNRSDYIDFLITRDIKFNKLDAFAELMGLLVLPMMGFFFFLLIAILTRGLLFYLFMAVFGIFAIMLSFIYYAKRKGPSRRRRRK